MVSNLVPLISPHRTYVEPFCGGASLLFAKPRSPVEVINDLDRTLVTFFKILRDPEQAAELKRQLEMTPYARAEYDAAYSWESADTELERVRQWFVVMRQAFGGDYGAGWAHSAQSSRRGMAHPVSRWLGAVESLTDVSERLRCVEIECVDFRKCLQAYDSPTTLFYCDPPYVSDTRATKSIYTHEISDADHEELVRLLIELKGMVMLSGYQNELYRTLESAGWERIEFPMKTHVPQANISRLECVWLKPGGERQSSLTERL